MQVLEFGEYFCSHFDQHYEIFDELGRRWFKAVHACLQVALVDLLRPFLTPTCEDIKTRASNLYSRCYIRPSDLAPSLCDIGLTNWWRVLATVYAAPIHTKVIEDALITAGECFRPSINRNVKVAISGTEESGDDLNTRFENLNSASHARLAEDAYIVVLNGKKQEGSD